MPPFCYLNGKVVPISEARLSVYDIGVLRGFGIYEAMRTFNHNVPFEFESHMERFHRSTEALRLHIPISDEEIKKAIVELVEKNVPPERDAIVRFINTGGEAIGGIEYDPKKPTFYILVEVLHPLPQKVLEEGCKLLMHEHQRAMPEYKTTNYITAVLLQEERKKTGAFEILYTHKGKVLEPATSNLFLVKDGKIITAHKDILGGITRKVVIGLAKKEFPLEEREVSVEEMYDADEAFLTSSFKDVVPVVEVGEKKIGTGVPGPITKRVMEIFETYAKNYGR